MDISLDAKRFLSQLFGREISNFSDVFEKDFSQLTEENKQSFQDFCVASFLDQGILCEDEFSPIYF